MGPEASPPPGNPDLRREGRGPDVTVPALSPQPDIPDDAFPQTSQRLTKQPSPVPLAFSSPNNLLYSAQTATTALSPHPHRPLPPH